MAEPRVVVGGTIAALVAADALGAAGVPTRLLVPPARAIGGGFRAMRRDGRRLELGVRLLELGYEDDPDDAPPLAAHVPGFGGHRAYTRRIRAWVEELAGDRLVAVPRPRLVMDGRAHDDVLFTVDLTPLPEILGSERTATVAREARAAATALGDAGILGRDLNGDLLGDASRANHGETLHATLVAPLADKFLADGAERTLAAWRRKVWMPLFWPRTVADACAGTLAFRPDRRFETIADDGPGALVDALLGRIASHPTVTVEEAGALTDASPTADGRVALTFSDGAAVDAARPVLGTGARELFAAVGHAYAVERARSVIAWVETPREEPVAMAHVVDADNPVVRVSDSGPGAAPGTRVLCAELACDTPAEEIDARALSGLRAAGVLADDADATVVFRGAMDTFDAPTAATRDAHASALAHLDATGIDAIVVGGAAAPGADAFNEQVVAGLAAAEALT